MKLTTSRSKEHQYVRALLFGDSGIGKTTSLRTLPADKTLIVLAGERGLVPLRNCDYRVISCTCWNDLREVAGGLMRPETARSPEITSVLDGCSIVAIDSLSDISDMCIRQIVGVDRVALVQQRTGGKEDAPRGIYDDLMTIEDWGLYRTRIANLVNVFTRLPKHVIFTCLAGWSEDKRAGETFRTPGLSGKFARECPAHFDLVMHMESQTDGDGKNVRVWRTAHDGRTIAKDASGVLEALEEADWMTIFRKILGTKKGAGK